MKGNALTLKEVGRIRRALRPVVVRYPTQAELARALGVCQQTVSGVLIGSQLPGLRFARGLALLLGIPLETLLSTPSAKLVQPPRAAA